MSVKTVATILMGNTADRPTATPGMKEWLYLDIEKKILYYCTGAGWTVLFG